MNSCKSVIFKRGASFKFQFSLPESVPDATFLGWTPSASLRRHHHDTDAGLIADIPVQWADPATTRSLAVDARDTARWPLGLAEFDIRLTGPDGQVLYTKTILFDIQRGITR